MNNNTLLLVLGCNELIILFEFQRYLARRLWNGLHLLDRKNGAPTICGGSSRCTTFCLKDQLSPTREKTGTVSGFNKTK